MKNTYEKPQIEIEQMESGNILTASSIQSTYDAITSGALNVNGDTVGGNDIVFSIRF